MSEKYCLGIRKEDKDIFKALQKGTKTIETRAAKGRFKRIEAGDVLVFNCANETVEKEVYDVSYYDSIEELAEDLSLERIFPSASSVEEAREIYHSFPNYKYKIEEYGLAAYKLR